MLYSCTHIHTYARNINEPKYSNFEKRAGMCSWESLKKGKGRTKYIITL